MHLTNLLQNLNMPIDKITENDLFVYLAKYKKERGVSNAYLDNIRWYSVVFWMAECKRVHFQKSNNGIGTY